MADEAPATGTESTNTTNTTEHLTAALAGTSEQSEPVTGDLFGEIAAIAEELGITPGQLKGRLEASRKWEDRAKANSDAAEELLRIKQESMSDIEKAVANARSEAFREVGISRVDDTVRAAAAGRQVDVNALLEGLDRARFLDSEGQPDRDAVQAWVDRIAPQRESAPSVVDLGQGVRSGTAVALNGDPLLADLNRALGNS